MDTISQPSHHCRKSTDPGRLLYRGVSAPCACDQRKTARTIIQQRALAFEAEKERTRVIAKKSGAGYLSIGCEGGASKAVCFIVDIHAHPRVLRFEFAGAESAKAVCGVNDSAVGTEIVKMLL